MANFIGKTLLVAAAALALATPSQAQSPIVIKFSHVVAPDTPKGKGAERFKELAEKYTGGKAKVEVYPNSTLYKDNDEMQAIQLAASPVMLAPSLAKFGPLGVREFEVFDLPFIIPSKAALKAVTTGPVGKGLLKKLEANNIVGLGYWDNGFKVMSANKPLRVPADFRGLKMRIQSSKVIEAQMRALGAVPQVLPFGETYTALQTKTVDGTENPPSNMYTQKMHEVQTHATLSDHGYIGYAVIVNKRFWDGLPADIRTQLTKAMDEATAYANDIAQKENDDAMEAMRKSGKTQFITLTADEKAQWVKALEPVATEMEARVGKELLQQFRNATKNVTN